VLLGANGCFRTTVVDRHVPRTAKHEEWSASYFWGLAGDPEFDVRRHCGSGAAGVQAGGNPLASGLTLLTLGIYVPRVVVVTCGPSPGPAESVAGRNGGGTSGQ
jgi:hypothetical protein